MNTSFTLSIGRTLSALLDPFRAVLRAMAKHHTSAREMQQWLQTQGVQITRATLHNFLTQPRLPVADFWDGMHAEATPGTTAETDAANNPVPALESLLHLHYRLIRKFASRGLQDGHAGCTRLADRLLRTVHGIGKDQAKAKLEKKAMEMAETKANQATLNKQTMAMNWCLEETKDYPEIAALFQAAFDACMAKVGEAPPA